MEKLEDLENIVDTLSVLISEIGDKELKSQLSDYQEEFLIEKEELETNLKAIQAEYEAEEMNVELPKEEVGQPIIEEKESKNDPFDILDENGGEPLPEAFQK